MRSYLLRILLIASVLGGIAGCVFSITPLTKSTDHVTPTATPVTPAETPPQEPHHTTHYYRCKGGYKPLSDDDRPKLGNVDPSDKAKLNIALAAFIQKQDQYMEDHRRKEQAAYKAWRSECDDFLN